MSYYGVKKAAIPVRSQKIKIVSKMKANRSRAAPLPGARRQAATKSYWMQAPEPKPRKERSARPAPQGARSKAALPADRTDRMDRHPAPPPPKKKLSHAAQSRRNYQHIIRLRDQIVSHHEEDHHLDQVKDDVGYAMRLANGLINHITEPKERKEKYNNPMFEFYRQQAGLKQQQQQQRPGRRTKPSSMSMLPSHHQRQQQHERQHQHHHQQQYEHEYDRNIRGGLYTDERYQVGKVSDHTIVALNHEISATVADCERTVGMLAKLGVASPSTNRLFGDGSSGNMLLPHIQTNNQQQHQQLQPSRPWQPQVQQSNQFNRQLYGQGAGQQYGQHRPQQPEHSQTQGSGQGQGAYARNGRNLHISTGYTNSSPSIIPSPQGAQPQQYAYLSPVPPPMAQMPSGSGRPQLHVQTTVQRPQAPQISPLRNSEGAFGINYTPSFHGQDNYMDSSYDVEASIHDQREEDNPEVDDEQSILLEAQKSLAKIERHLSNLA